MMMNYKATFHTKIAPSEVRAPLEATFFATFIIEMFSSHIQRRKAHTQHDLFHIPVVEWGTPTVNSTNPLRFSGVTFGYIFFHSFFGYSWLDFLQFFAPHWRQRKLTWEWKRIQIY